MRDHDHEGISAVLRALTRDARRLVVRGGSAAEVATLSARIEAIRDRVSGPTPTPLTRWLDSLQRRVAPAETRVRTACGAGAMQGATSCR